jgi:hypothetical protein
METAESRQILSEARLFFRLRGYSVIRLDFSFVCRKFGKTF